MTSRFLSNLSAKLVSENPLTWELLAPLIYSCALINRIIVVPAGFKSDLASVPRIPFAYWLTGGFSNQAAVLHDFLYITCPVDKATADAIFLEAMEATGISWWRRRAMYAAVRVGGRGNFNKVKPT